MTQAYYATIPERPTDVLELRAFNDGNNRGCKIIYVHEDKSNETWAQVLQFPSKIVSIAGFGNITKYTFKNIRKMLTNCNLPVKCRLEPMGARPFTTPSLKTNGSHQSDRSDSESEAETPTSARSKYKFSRFQSKKSLKYNGKYSSSKYSAPPKKSRKNASKHHKTDSNSSIQSNISINLGTAKSKQCFVCSKILKESKQHRCRRCASIVCSKCSKNKRKEVGYDKLVRVCDSCRKRDEFEVTINSKPFGIQITSLYNKTDDLGGILISNVKENGGVNKAEQENNVRIEKTVIISIQNENIELLTYNYALEKLRIQTVPFTITCKKWNKYTKKSAKEQLEKEHDEAIQRKLRELQQIEEDEKIRKEAKKNMKKNKNKNYDEDDGKYIFPDSTLSPTQNGINHRRTKPDSPRFRSNYDVPESPHSNKGDVTPTRDTSTPRRYQPKDNIFAVNKTSTERYAGSEQIEDHPAMELIVNAEAYEKNDDLKAAVTNYTNAIKQFNQTVHEIDNNKVKRKWREKINDYEIQLLRLSRKLKLREKIAGKKDRHRRANTLAVTKSSKTRRKSTGTDYTSNVKNPEEKGGGGDGGGDDEKGGGDGKKDKKKSDQDAAFRNRLETDIITEKPNVSFKDVQGLANVKLAIYETVILPQKRPELFTGLRAPAMGLLLFGPPGNGKTMIAKCVATEIDSTFFSISASSITSKYVGDAERIMRTLFNLAREKAPSIIFIDEIDSLLTARGGNNEAESSRRIKTEFLVQFDGVHSAKDLKASILVIGATNLPDQLDEAVLRRFSKRILVPQPEYDTRYGLIRNLMRDEPHTMTNSEFVKIAKATERYSCSDLAHLCKDAALGPLREMGGSLADDDFDDSNIPKTNISHFQNSLKNVRSSLSKESLLFYKDWDKKYGSKFSLSVTQLPEFLQPNPIEPLD